MTWALAPTYSIRAHGESSEMMFPMLSGFFFPIPPPRSPGPEFDPGPALDPGGDAPPTLNGASWIRVSPALGAGGFPPPGAAYAPYSGAYGAGPPGPGGGGGPPYVLHEPSPLELDAGGGGYPLYPCDWWWCGGVLSW